MSELDKSELSSSALVIAPHPDDETLGCGGTIIKKKRAGARIRIVFTTDGRHAQYLIPEQELKAMREREAIEAIRSLGLVENDIIFLEFEDTKLKENQESAVGKVTEILIQERPSQVFIPYYQKDVYPDHVATNRIVLSALGRCGIKAIVYEYPIWLWYNWPWVSFPRRRQLNIIANILSNFQASFRFLTDFRCFVHIGDVLKLKLAALEKHESQMKRLIPDPRYITLPDVKGGEFIQCFYQEREIFHRYCFDGKRK